jgi:hypothetical protein
MSRPYLNRMQRAKKSISNPEVVQDIELTPEQQQELALEKVRLKHEDKKKYLRFLEERVLILEKENDVFLSLKNAIPKIIDIYPKAASKDSESAMVIVWSDWHWEERVLLSQVSNKNEYNLDIAQKRFLNLLQGSLSWYKIQSRDTTIKTIILGLLGDFITGSIHDDLAEGNQLPPAKAAHAVMSVLVSGIKFMLENTPKDVEFIIPCHSGNHGRMTHEQRIATEAGNSLEYFMYLMLQEYFEKEKRIKFIVQDGYHSYVRLFEGAYEMRIHHGHQINYQGGVGGITIPVNKAIAQWNKAHQVDLDVFGHFHQRFDGGNFICNGSLIGYNAYAVSIKASYEPPSQTCFLINREFEAKTAVMPIFVSE